RRTGDSNGIRFHHRQIDGRHDRIHDCGRDRIHDRRHPGAAGDGCADHHQEQRLTVHHDVLDDGTRSTPHGWPPPSGQTVCPPRSEPDAAPSRSRRAAAGAGMVVQGA
ncbi:MAG: hypothetical protein GYA65_15705, partial [Actinobacteria bacterium]|nr:hypothetical protein [Actinomycetota bacterium]